MHLPGSSVAVSDVDAGLRVLYMHDTISRAHPWEVLTDLYFCRDPETIQKEEQALLNRL